MNRFVCALVICLTAFGVFAQGKKPVIIFASDTQQPMPGETMIRKPNHNRKATEMIFKDIEQTRPAGFFILGDLVSMWYKNKTWTAVDTYIKQCRKDSIPVYATLGNHEVMINTKKGTNNFRSRFPTFDPAGYVEIIDSVAVILLNSNFDKMTAAGILAQDNWYNNMVKKLDNDPAVRFIIVGCHHPPYTNSKAVKPSIQVRQNFVPAFIKSQKCVLFLSGHSHNFERFNVQGKYFLVIGGGGGLHQPLNTKEVTPDLSPVYKPMFHYLLISRFADSLQIVSERLKPDFSGFEDGLSFSVQTRQ